MIPIDNFGFQWHITDRCDQRCAHCYASDYSDNSELRIQSLIGIANDIFGYLNTLPVTVNLTGGEPLLYKDLFQLLRHIVRFDNLAELNLITNAVSVSDTAIASLAALPKLTSIKISLESHMPHVNDAVRGHGHFRRVWDNIAKITKAGIPVVLMVTLGGWNSASIPGILELAARKGIDGVIFERFVPIGTGKKMLQDSLNANQWCHVVQSITKELAIDITIDDLLPYRAFQVSTLNGSNAQDRLSGALCNLGPESMALMPDGTVYPCRRLPLPVGTLPVDSMAQIIESLRGYSPQNLLTHMKKSGCSSCVHEDCAGCRALAVAMGNGLYGEDFQCVRLPGASAPDL